MKFHEVLAGIAWLLLSERRVTYRRLSREFDLDREALEDVRHELIQVKRCAVDQDGEFLVWAGTAERAASAPLSPALPGLEPLTPLRETTPATRARSRDGATTAETAAALPAARPASDLPPAPAAPEPAGAERRQLTVMFCDLMGSTDLSGRLDPEDLREVVRAYQETAATAIQRYEGHIAQYLGDGLLVYFGFPLAHEDDAHRAVHAALGILDGLGALNARLHADHGVKLAVRIGIHTGSVVVGQMGGGGRHEQLALGETPNVAARLEGLAGPDGVVISPITARLVADSFRLEAMGPQALKGLAEPMDTWRVSGRRERHPEPLEGVAGAAGAALLVGRDEESGLLRRRWEQAKTGQGQVVLVCGEAGIGKSVLVAGLRAQAGAEGAPRFTLRASAYHTDSALYCVSAYLEGAMRFAPADDPTARVAKLEARLQGLGLPLQELVPLFAALLSVPLPAERYAPLALSPQQQKQQTLDALVAWLTAEAERQPLVVTWEDLHWADPTTLELLGLVIDEAPTVPILHVLTYRPVFTPPWAPQSHLTPIVLARLERGQVEALIALRANHKALPAEVMQHIVDKTDGVPLYVEELTIMLLNSALLREMDDCYELVGPLNAAAIPDTLQDALMARLDRLPQVRELAQLGSVIGREFAYDMILGVSTGGDAILQDGLGQLVKAELLYQRGRPPRAKYFFKHALIQDAAYGSLLRRTRQQYHLQVAELLEARFAEVVETHPELVAHHYSEANVPDRALHYLQKAGDRALRMSANTEAIAHLSKGLELLGTMPDNPERARHELRMLTTLGPALIATKGYAAPEVEPAYRRALALCRALGDAEREFSMLLGLSLFHFVRADLHVSRGLAEQLVDVARTQDEPGCDLAAERALGYALVMLGELAAARSCMERVTASYDHAVHGAFALRRGGSDFGVGASSLGAWILFVLGYPDQAMDRSAQGLAIARQLGHPISEAFAHFCAGGLHQMRGEAKASAAHAEASGAIAEEKGFVQYAAWATVLRSRALFEQGGGAGAIAGIRKGIDGNHAIGSRLFVPYWNSLLAGAYAQSGQAEEGLVVIAEALDQVARTEERFSEAELYRVKGQLLLERDAASVSEADACFRRAIEIARSQQARSWELRAATSLARLWTGQGRSQEARALLAPILAWFTEGFDTRDLRDARGLLDELGA